MIKTIDIAKNTRKLSKTREKNQNCQNSNQNSLTFLIKLWWSRRNSEESRKLLKFWRKAFIKKDENCREPDNMKNDEVLKIHEILNIPRETFRHSQQLFNYTRKARKVCLFYLNLQKWMRKNVWFSQKAVKYIPIHPISLPVTQLNRFYYAHENLRCNKFLPQVINKFKSLRKQKL